MLLKSGKNLDEIETIFKEEKQSSNETDLKMTRDR